MSSPGKFITFEGPEGSGKSTHAAFLADAMKTAGYSVVSVREPGGTRVGEAIRKLLSRADDAKEPMCRETELFLFLASRAQLVRSVIVPALRDGSHVVCDRFADSTTAYQGYGRACDLDALAAMNSFSVQGLVPDVTILLDVDPVSGLKRVERRDARSGAVKDRIELESIEFHERVRAGYQELARMNPDRFRIVDASRPVDEVREGIWREIRSVIER